MRSLHTRDMTEYRKSSHQFLQSTTARLLTHAMYMYCTVCQRCVNPGVFICIYLTFYQDYGAAGMRLGCVISQNEEFSKAVRAIW